ncbi:hypothetical protein G3T14_02935 [Methylobacterium sp. BTF04]|uniref:hypothetical protein n=1 Tax=Methylobacterium sp. BTF04 TaxID=2708300 RepID=UPI0013D61E79|nr:hypothetical protein [Methylobacterium sp. BTF04]NEU11087.1 hypothetical protein [Methylobacterium sp. BTF04]
MQNQTRISATLMICVMQGSCALSPYQLEDPSTIAGLGPRISDVVKSIRCEVSIFIVENKLRSSLISPILAKIQRDTLRGADAAVADGVAAVRQYPFIDIDARQFASLNIDLKNIDTRTLTLGYDYLKPALAKKTRQMLDGSVVKGFGGSYAETRTFEFVQPHAIPQNADLGPAKSYSPKGERPPVAAQYSTIYNAQPLADTDFYCFKSLYNSKSRDLAAATNELQHLVRSDLGWTEYENFTRIHIGDSTLAQWLQNASSEMVRNEKTIYPTSENLFVGQLSYSFTLDVKPDINGKYSLISGFINPFGVSFDASLEHSSAYTIVLNTNYAAQALGASSGNTCNSEAPGPPCL